MRSEDERQSRVVRRRASRRSGPGPGQSRRSLRGDEGQPLRSVLRASELTEGVLQLRAQLEEAQEDALRRRRRVSLRLRRPDSGDSSAPMQQRFQRW